MLAVLVYFSFYSPAKDVNIIITISWLGLIFMDGAGLYFWLCFQPTSLNPVGKCQWNLGAIQMDTETILLSLN